jgi:hypothetical protein
MCSIYTNVGHHQDRHLFIIYIDYMCDRCDWCVSTCSPIHTSYGKCLQMSTWKKRGKTVLMHTCAVTRCRVCIGWTADSWTCTDFVMHDQEFRLHNDRIWQCGNWRLFWITVYLDKHSTIIISLLCVHSIYLFAVTFTFRKCPLTRISLRVCCNLYECCEKKNHLS